MLGAGFIVLYLYGRLSPVEGGRTDAIETVFYCCYVVYLFSFKGAQNDTVTWSLLQGAVNRSRQRKIRQYKPATKFSGWPENRLNMESGELLWEVGCGVVV